MLFLLLASRYYVLGESIQWAPAVKKYPFKGSESYLMIIYIVVWLWRIWPQKPLPTLLLLLLSSGYCIRAWREYIVADCCRDEGTRRWWYCLHTGINKSWWVLLYAFISCWYVLILLEHFFFFFFHPIYYLRPSILAVEWPRYIKRGRKDRCWLGGQLFFIWGDVSCGIKALDVREEWRDDSRVSLWGDDSRSFKAPCPIPTYLL